MGQSKYVGMTNSHGSKVINSFSKKNSSGQYKSFLVVRCVCGNDFNVLTQHFKSGATVSCGCIRKAQNLKLTGQTINNLLVLDMLPPIPSDLSKKQRALVKCHCNNEFTCVASELKRKRVKSCGCLSKHSMSVRRAKNGGPSVNEKAWLWYFKQYATSAKKRKLSFEYNIDSFKTITQKKCYYCGLAPSPKNRYRNDKLAKKETIDQSTIYVNGIDRLNPNKGYISNNCVPCCTECNYHKGRYTLDEFMAWLQRINNWKELEDWCGVQSREKN